jgi:integrase
VRKKGKEMPYQFTVLIEVPQVLAAVPYEQRKADHDLVVAAYLRTFEKRGLEEETSRRTRKFLDSFFKSILIRYPAGDPHWHILIWDLLHPYGSEIIDLYAASLNKYAFKRGSQIKYLSEIRRLCEITIQKAYIPSRTPVAIKERYVTPSQPVTRYDHPVHAIDDPNVDPAVIGDSLRHLLDFVRVEYVKNSRNKDLARRDYVAIVVAVTSGVRANELCHLDIDDIRFEARRIWVRFGKGHNGSGKRQRLTILTDFAAETLRIYLKHSRPKLARADVATDALFLTQQGNRVTYGAMKARLNKIVRLAKESDIKMPNSFGWHDPRRSFTTGNTAEHPEKLIHISGLLGHTGLGTMHRYVRPSKRTLRDATKKVAGQLVPPTS